MKFVEGVYECWRKNTGRDRRTGLVCGDFAIEKRPRSAGHDDERGWYITHLATGFSCGPPSRTKKWAEAYVVAVMKIAPPDFWRDKRWQLGVMPDTSSALFKAADKYNAQALKALRAKFTPRI